MSLRGAKTRGNPFSYPFNRHTLYGIVTAGRCRLGLTFLSLNKKVSKEVSLRLAEKDKLFQQYAISRSRRRRLKNPPA